jgi:choline dehydrogenase-like flavoprotein
VIRRAPERQAGRANHVYDAIVVGTGITGGWAAKELTEAGLDTLVLEAGPMIVPERDYVEHVPAHEQPFRGIGDRQRERERQPVQSRCYACDEMGQKFFVDDIENPYSTPEDQPFDWIRGRQVGGKSIMWARQSYRLGPLDFEAPGRDGIGIEWPISYEELAPWYDHVERFAGISGQAEGLLQLPDSQFLPAMPLNCVEEHARQALLDRWGGARVLTPGRSAVLTEGHNGRAACHYCGPCHRGCITRSYFSSLNATLPAAEATGNMTLRPNSVVRHVDWQDGKATGVTIVDRETHESVEFRARTVVLAASTLESTRILFNSANAEFSSGLANSSGVLGRYLMDHTMGVGAAGRFEGWSDRSYVGRRPNGIYIARFRNVTDRHPEFVRGYGYQGSAYRADWNRGISEPGFGAAYKDRLSGPGSWYMSIGAWGECLPHADNRAEIDPELVDAWGIPTLRISMRWRDNEYAMANDSAAQAAEMLEAAGAVDVRTRKVMDPPGLCIHEMGTARMGTDPRTSVLNGYNQTWDVPNLFVVDGSSMTTSGCQNPSLTYMAITARACDHIIGRFKRREL